MDFLFDKCSDDENKINCDEDIYPELCIYCHNESIIDNRCCVCYPIKIFNLDSRYKSRLKRFKDYLRELQLYIAPGLEIKTIIKYNIKEGVKPLEFNKREVLNVVENFLNFSIKEKSTNYLYIIKMILDSLQIENKIKTTNSKNSKRIWELFISSNSIN